ncbi:hypothetical protein Tco_0957434 [Tanacetum coccineum]
MYTFSPMMVANSRKHHCRVRPYTQEVLVLSTNLESQTKHYPLVFRNRRGDEARIKKTCFHQSSRHVQFLQQLQPEWSRFVTVVKQRQEIDTVSYHKLFDVLKQFQNEVNDIRSERLARSANSISTCVAASQRPNHITTIRHQKTFKDRSAPSYMQSLTPRPNALPRHKAKEIVKPVTPSI